MRVGRPGNRSSLLSHTFPSFYACYLLKSVQTPKSNATYIGSTPNPPRRIRQHNGELTQGAWKTSRGRPWVMQMIVHGFPSKLAALQFEWAWQHPHLSRHIRDGNGKVFTTSGRGLKQNIQILRFMISIHPYNLWPLHVKVFTPQAMKIWQEFTNVRKVTKGKGKQKADADGSITLPRGFTHTVELEGVDGKSAGGSGRTEPIDVQDEKFTSAHLNKHINLLASKEPLQCSVCHEPLTNYTSDPLTHALCPQHACNGTAHLLCLSQHFLNQGPSDLMVPRGGDCPSCSSFVLWGDVIKGCYRRATGGAVSVEEEEETLDKMYNSDSLAEDFAGSSKSNRKAKGVTSPRKKRERRSRKESSTSSQGEEFDFDVVERERYSDEPGIGKSPRRIAGSPSKLKTGQIHLTLPTPVTPSASARTRKPKTKTPSTTRKPVRRAKEAQESSEGELFDFDGVERLSFSEDEALKSKRKAGRPKVLSAVPGPSSRLTGVVKRGRPRKNSSSAGLSSNLSRSPTKKLSSTSKRTFMTGQFLSELTAPPESSPRLGVLPLFESDDEDTAAKILGDDVLRRSMSSLSISSPSSSL